MNSVYVCIGSSTFHVLENSGGSLSYHMKPELINWIRSSIMKLIEDKSLTHLSEASSSMFYDHGPPSPRVDHFTESSSFSSISCESNYVYSNSKPLSGQKN